VGRGVAVAEARHGLGTQRMGNVCHWKSLQSNRVKTHTENTSLCVTEICSHELCVKVSNKPDQQSKHHLLSLNH
jgi:hypothetical protein